MPDTNEFPTSLPRTKATLEHLLRTLHIDLVIVAEECMIRMDADDDYFTRRARGVVTLSDWIEAIAPSVTTPEYAHRLSCALAGVRYYMRCVPPACDMAQQIRDESVCRVEFAKALQAAGDLVSLANEAGALAAVGKTPVVGSDATPVAAGATAAAGKGGKGTGAADHTTRRGRLPADESKAKRMAILALLGEQPALMSRPDLLAIEAGVSVSTVRRVVRAESTKNRERRKKE